MPADVHQDGQEPVTAEVVAAPQRGFSRLAWLIVAALIAVILILPERAAEEQAEEALEPLTVRIMEVQSKWAVAASRLATSDKQRADAFEDLRALDTGPTAMQLRFVILAGELKGPDEALAQLSELQSELEQEAYPISDEQRQTMMLLKTLYEQYAEGNWDVTTLAAQQRQYLEQQLGWFGQLALHPAKTPDTRGRAAVLRAAQMTMIAVVVLLGCGMCVGLAGLAGCSTLAALWASGRLHSRLQIVSSDAGIYAETFALWMFLFVGTSGLVALMEWREQPLLLNLVVATGSLIAVAWPLLRGVPWKRLPAELGLTRGRGVLREMGWGVVCYVSALPLLFLSMLLLLVMIWLMGLGGEADEVVAPQGPAHPIIQWLSDASWWQILQVVVLASVVAPIVEETFFRGVLYQHLRSATSGWRVTASVVYSALVSSLIFAVIHPQGWLGVPMLTSIAFAFALAREWRGSLIAPMTAHAVNNGVATCMLLLLLNV